MQPVPQVWDRRGEHAGWKCCGGAACGRRGVWEATCHWLDWHAGRQLAESKVPERARQLHHAGTSLCLTSASALVLLTHDAFCHALILCQTCSPAFQDAYGGPLTFSGGNSDTLMLALLRAAYSGRSDTHLVASMEQALPLQPDWLNFNRFCVRAEGSAPIVKGLRAHVSGKGALSAALPCNDCRPCSVYTLQT